MKKVLIVEDDRNIALALGVRLKAMGYDVASASDAVTAVTQARKAQPDVVLLDIGLPGGDGFMVAERLKQLTQTATTPLIFITAMKTPGLKDRAQALGAVRFIEKPFKATQIADAIESALMPGDDWESVWQDSPGH